jgi:hypothetical protein
MKASNLILRIFLLVIFSHQGFSAAPPPRPGQPGNGGNGSNGTNGTNGSQGISASADCQKGNSRADLDINNVRARYMNQGDMFYDPGLGLPRYEVPKRQDNTTTSKHSMFAAAIWLGGLERGSGNLVVMAQLYRGSLANYWPGPIRQPDPAKPIPISAPVCAAWDQIFKCNRQTVRKFKDDFEAGLITDCDAIPDEIKLWPGKGNPYLKQSSKFAADPEAVESVDNNLANFFDSDSNGIYNPCNGDYPLWAGTEKDLECEGTEININSGADQVLWWVSNDIGNLKTYSGVGAPFVPGLGMEIHYEAFAYAATDATNDMTFLRQRLYNKGSYILDQTYLAQWADPDLGNAGDDYVGCDVMRGLGICYNGDDFDEGNQGYGSNPPAIGVDFFRGPFPDDNLDIIDWDLDCDGPTSNPPDNRERIVMSGFMYFNIGSDGIRGDPNLPSEFYNYLRNKWKNGNDLTFGGAGISPATPNTPRALYAFPNVTESSDPYGFACGNRGCEETRSCGAAWNERTAGNPPGDRRFLANNGPFTLKPGSRNECTIGIVWARANSGGATGSFGKLLAADDLAQDRFNTCFKRNIGPNNPNLEISELDRKLLFTIDPDTIVKSPLMTTESYLEQNRSVTGGPNNEDVYFRFQGYKLFQLVDDKVSVQDLDNPDKARPLDGDVNGDGVIDFNGIMDKADGVTTISNLEFNQDLNQDILTPKVKDTPDKGIFRTFMVEKDLFSSLSGGRLSNFKKYYFAVVAYGFNNNSQAKRPYIQGVENYKIYTAIPHKANPEGFGTELKYDFGNSFEVTRIQGIGNSGNLLELKDGEADKILSNNEVNTLTYKPQSGPVDFKIYSPKNLKGGKFRMVFSSRIRYDITKGYQFKVGDIIESDTTFVLNETGFRVSPRFEINKATVRVKRVIPVSGLPNFVDLDVENLGCRSGAFSIRFDKIERDSRSGDTVLVESKLVGLPMVLVSDPSQKNQAMEYVPFDFWALNDLNTNETTFSTNPVSSLAEEIVPKYGISIRPKNGSTPGSDVFNALERNGVLRSEIIYGEDFLKKWLWDYADYQSTAGWVREDKFAVGNIYQSLDPFRSFRNQANGCWAPFILTTTTGNSSNPGPMVPVSTTSDPAALFYRQNPRGVFRSLSLCKNVDIVFTPDKSKWTRCAVLQYDTLNANSVNQIKFRLRKSSRLSVNKNFQPDGSTSPFIDSSKVVLSKGMSWFPGYAIDLDRGQRLNIMFSESYLLDDEGASSGAPWTGKGNDLQWEPRGVRSGSDLGTRNFIYVMNTKYDEGKKMEQELDSIYKKFGNQVIGNFNPKVWNWQITNIMYAGLMGRGIDIIREAEIPMLQNDIKVKLRVQRGFEPFFHNPGSGNNCDPIYQFEIPTDGSKRSSSQAGLSAMDLIRIVPNPYLSLSGYETSQIDNRVKIVNLPSQCVISIFNLSGSLIRQFNFDQTASKPYSFIGNGEVNYTDRGTNFQTFIDWDLKNSNGLPIASGVYIVHIKSEKFGEKVLKWFGVLRPIDLDTFN